MGPAASSSVDGPSGTRAGYLDHPGPATVTAPAKAAAVDLCLHLIHLDHGRHNRQRGRPSQTRARNRRQSGPHAGLRSPWGRTTTRRRLSPRQCCPRGTTCLGPAHRDPFQGPGSTLSTATMCGHCISHAARQTASCHGPRFAELSTRPRTTASPERSAWRIQHDWAPTA